IPARIADKIRSYAAPPTAFPCARNRGQSRVGMASRRSELAREPHGTAFVREQARSYESTSAQPVILRVAGKQRLVLQPVQDPRPDLALGALAHQHLDVPEVFRK